MRLSVRIERHLATKLEGKLFASVWVRPNIGAHEFSCGKDFFTVKGGKVYELEGANLTKVEMSLLDLETSCRRIGNYNPGKVPVKKKATYTYAQIQKLLF